MKIDLNNLPKGTKVLLSNDKILVFKDFFDLPAGWDGIMTIKEKRVLTDGEVRKENGYYTKELDSLSPRNYFIRFGDIIQVLSMPTGSKVEEVIKYIDRK